MKIYTLAVLLFFMVAGCTRAEPVRDTFNPDLRATLASANQAFIQAFRSSDPAQLSPYFSGEILVSLSKTIQRAKEQGMYSVSELQDVRWGEVRIREREAQVETTERWKHTHHLVATDECAYVVPARDVSQTYYLEKHVGEWTITRIVDAPGNEPSKAVPCT